MTVGIVDILEVVDIENHERNRIALAVQFLLFAKEDSAKASTVETTGKRVFLAGTFVLALLDFEGAEVLLELFLFFLVHRAFAAVVEEPDNQDDKERDEPERDKSRHEIDLGNFLALETEFLDFHSTVTERSVSPRLDFDKRNVREIDPRLVDIDFVLGNPLARHCSGQHVAQFIFVGRRHKGKPRNRTQERQIESSVMRRTIGTD